MSLKELSFELEYRSLKKDVIKEFYEPALRHAVSYQRAVGYFSSSSLMEMSAGLQSLVKNEGKIQLVASPELSEEDIEAIQYGYKTREEIMEKVLLENWKEPENPFEEKRLNLLANYISRGILDIKLAFIHNAHEHVIGIFHEKLGLISDGENTIAFSGSMNETKNAFRNNYETIDVFCDWKSEESAERVRKKKEAFEDIWNDRERNIEVLEFPKVILEKIKKYDRGTVKEELDEKDFLEEEWKYIQEREGPAIPEWFEVRDYQKKAVEEWEKRGFQGIFDMATGTGKTYTALLAMVRLYQVKKGNLGILIVCPYQHLVEQWVEDMVKFRFVPIVAYSQSSCRNYKEQVKSAVFGFAAGARKNFCIICTNATFQSPIIQKAVNMVKSNLLLVVDEAHNFGTEGMEKFLESRYSYRLALSATIERYNDQMGTKRIVDFFGERCITYDLETAIQEKMLTPYEYIPVVVCLNEEEQKEYQELTREIGKCIREENGRRKLSRRGEMLVLERARLTAGASGKKKALFREMQNYREDTHMLVYCGTAMVENEDNWSGEEIRQIDDITRMLGKTLHMRVAKFTSEENREERAERIEHFAEGDLQALIAIKCLDEGVNVPQIKTAFILASTTNPKEYIQRRGRVLRKSKGKDFARIYDFVTLPRPLDEVESISEEERKEDLGLVKNEVQRVEEFKRLSRNPYISDDLLKNVRNIYHLY